MPAPFLILEEIATEWMGTSFDAARNPSTGSGCFRDLLIMLSLLRLFFRLLYHEFAFTYDWVSWFVSMGQWRSWQRAALPYLRGRRVLEVADGTGDMLLDMAALGFEPIGFDLSPQMGRVARRKLRAHHLATRIPLTRGQAQALPFASASLPAILSTFPTEFIVAPAVIAEFYRVVQPGGVVVFVPSAQITGLNFADRFAHWLFRVTGQSASDWFEPFRQRYAQAGFAVRLETVTLPRSVVAVVVAEKK